MTWLQIQSGWLPSPPSQVSRLTYSTASNYSLRPLFPPLLVVALKRIAYNNPLPPTTQVRAATATTNLRHLSQVPPDFAVKTCSDSASLKGILDSAFPLLYTFLHKSQCASSVNTIADTLLINLQSDFIPGRHYSILSSIDTSGQDCT